MLLRRLLPIAMIVALLLSYVPLSSAAMPCCASAGMKAADMKMAGMADGAMTAKAPAPEAAPAAIEAHSQQTATMPHCHMSTSHMAASSPVATSTAQTHAASATVNFIRSTAMTVCQQTACVVPTSAVTAALFSAEPPHTALFIADGVTASVLLPASTAHTTAPSPPPPTQRLTAPLPLRI